MIHCVWMTGLGSKEQQEGIVLDFCFVRVSLLAVS